MHCYDNKREVLSSPTHPEESVQRAVLHEFCDDPLWRGVRHHPLQLQHIGVVKLSEHPRLTQEHGPLPVRHAPAEGLHGHQDLSPAQGTVPPPRHLAKLG